MTNFNIFLKVKHNITRKRVFLFLNKHTLVILTWRRKIDITFTIDETKFNLY